MRRPDSVPWLAGLALVGLWWLAARGLDLPPVVLPPPDAVLRALWTRAGDLLPAAGVTAGLAAAALGVSIVLGCAIALAFARIPLLERALGPWTLVLQATPVVAVAPLVIIWTGIDHPRRAILILAVIVALFPVLASALAGLKAVDPGLDRLFRLHGARGWQRFVRLELPSAAPFLLAGIKTSAGLSLVGVVVAEFVAGAGSVGGLAWRIMEAGNRLETATQFAGLLLLAALGIAVHGALGWAERRIAR